MTKSEIIALQRQLRTAGFYEGDLDGLWGPLTQTAFNTSQRMALESRKSSPVPTVPAKFTGELAWGKVVSAEFRTKVLAIVKDLGMPALTGASDLMACMAWESGETFSAGITNGAGSGAVGLIQFMPSTAKALGTSSAALAKMTPEAQLDFVYRYFLPYKGKLKNLADLYMAILWPTAIGKEDDYVLWEAAKRPTTYLQNKGLDVNGDRAITKAECAIKVNEKLKRGFLKKHVFVV